MLFAWTAAIHCSGTKLCPKSDRSPAPSHSSRSPFFVARSLSPPLTGDPPQPRRQPHPRSSLASPTPSTFSRSIPLSTPQSRAPIARHTQTLAPCAVRRPGRPRAAAAPPRPRMRHGWPTYSKVRAGHKEFNVLLASDVSDDDGLLRRVPVSRTVGTMARSPLAISRDLEPSTASLPPPGSVSSNAQGASSSGRGSPT
jgi:hypothetical protein